MPEARRAFLKLESSRQRLVGKQLRKLERAPQLGAPCGTRAGIDLSGCRKLYVDKKTLRIIYRIHERKQIVEVINIGDRADLAAYREALRALKKRGS